MRAASMIIEEDYVDLETPTGTMRTFQFRPAAKGRYPGVMLFSEIYQVTDPIARVARLLAGEGYIVVAPEIYHEFEPLGTPFAYNENDTEKGNRYKIEKEVAAYDSDARVLLEYLQSVPDGTGKVGCMGICLGGHLSFRAAMNPGVQASVCFYATDVHTGTLGKGQADDSLARVGEIQGELLMVWGKQDRHIPREGRALINKHLSDAGVCFAWHEFNARHAFVRDEGYRYNPALARIAMAMVLELFHRRLQLEEPFESES